VNREERVEYRKLYRAENPEKIREGNREWRAKSREKIREYKKVYRAENREKTRQWASDHRVRCVKVDPEKYRAQEKSYRSTRRARKLAASGLFTAEEFISVCARQKGRCFYCGKKAKLEADHYVAISRGGSNSIENIRGACRTCNASKQAKHPVDFALERGFLCF
jgi:5-methylcytosine-specific restriction endonuclease McrA